MNYNLLSKTTQSINNLTRFISIKLNNIIANLLRILPVSSEMLGPIKGFYQSTSDFISSQSPNLIGDEYRYQPVYFESDQEMRKPISLDQEEHWEFKSFYNDPMPETFVAHVPNARVWGYSGTVIVADDKILADVSREFIPNLKCHSSWNKMKFPSIRKLEGTAAVLSATGGEGFYHFLLDVVPRLKLIECAKISYTEIDYFIVNSYQKKFHQEILDKLGICKEKIIESETNPHVKVDQLIVPSLTGNIITKPSWVRDYLSQKILGDIDYSLYDQVVRKNNRIYINREQANIRKVKNQDQVLEVLENFKFELVTLELMSVTDQALLFSSADVVVAPHGAGLSNIIFCHPGTKVIEIFSPNYVKPFYWSLANISNLEYYYIMGEGEAPEPYVDPNKITEDIMVNIESLIKILKIAQV
ncbi:glycosyltransferase family 61 protein [Roseofilum capinflatum]|uniref:Glycosyltransferase family 61 protein n=1 Tax=Roseofilum capinflatum BLCC-M114 TaxID=3022440 RepID=A0ABT7B8B3_9CYAN|nr:glycosyltransferase family 61 protein [Roseofilum capinflatum]MDJ1175413.1 glycosyltransferase family 61 protein [Roseofilum capinflatum BLCC-M114]